MAKKNRKMDRAERLAASDEYLMQNVAGNTVTIATATGKRYSVKTDDAIENNLDSVQDLLRAQSKKIVLKGTKLEATADTDGAVGIKQALSFHGTEIANSLEFLRADENIEVSDGVNANEGAKAPVA